MQRLNTAMVQMNLPETMCAVMLTGHGGLDKLEYIQDWPTPKPASGEVLVRVSARIGERVILDPWLLASGDWLDASRSMYFGSECDGDPLAVYT